MLARAHRRLKLTQGNTFPSIMQTNIFIALFGGWHDLWEKLPISSISVAVYQGTVKGAGCREVGGGGTTVWYLRCSVRPSGAAPCGHRWGSTLRCKILEILGYFTLLFMSRWLILSLHHPVFFSLFKPIHFPQVSRERKIQWLWGLIVL